MEKSYGTDGGYVYTLALRDNKKIKSSPAHSSNTEPVYSAGNASNSIITQNDTDVNTKFSLSNSDGTKLTKEQNEYLEAVKKAESSTAATTQNAIGAIQENSAKGSISQNNLNVNAKYSLSNLNTENSQIGSAWNIRGEDVRLEKAPTQADIAPVAETANETVIRNLSAAVTSATTTYAAIRNNKLNTTRQSSSFTPGLFLFVFECELVSTCASGHARWPRSADKP